MFKQDILQESLTKKWKYKISEDMIKMCSGFHREMEKSKSLVNAI